MNTTAVIISILAALSGIILGWSARAKEGISSSIMLRADVDYIRRGIDDIRIDQKAQGQRLDELSERVTRVEESSKQAHKRLDNLQRVS